MKVLLRHKAFIQRYLFERLGVSGMSINLLTLNFPSGLETRFRRDSYLVTLKALRGALLIGIVLYALFALLDYMVLLEVLKELSIIRFYIVIPVFFIVFGLSFTKCFFQWGEFFMLLAILFAAIGIIAMTVVAPVFGRNIYYPGIMLVLFFNYISRVHFVYATLMGWSILLFYWLSTVFFPGITDKVLFANLFFLTSVNLMGMFVSYSMEFYLRKNYYFSSLLENERRKVIKSNEVLEEKVKEKTFSLQKDIECRERVEQDLIIAKDKAEESDRLKTAFLANMSHEIRTPMNGILGFSHLLENKDLSEDARHRYVDIIHKSGNRMLNTINDIIDISKIQAGEINVNLGEVNLGEELIALVDFFKVEAEAKGLKFEFHNHIATSSTIKTDLNKLTFIITNLIKNAIKYTDEGFIKVLATEKDNNFYFEVSDSGIGIPLNRQAAVFERFVQSDIEDSAARQGSGLGLTIAKSYVEMLGGSIHLSSTVNKGSVFSFSLPWNV